MDFGDLKKWHIALALPVFTGVLTFSYLSLEPQANARTTSPMMFQQALMSKPVGKENPIPRVQNVRIYPPVDGLFTVNFDQLVEDRQNDRWLKQQWSFTARSPNPGSNQTVLEWLEQLRNSDPDRVSYTYEWWREPQKLWTIWGIFTGILMVWGVVVPTTLWFAKGGYSEFKANAKATPAPAGPAAQPAVTAADQDRLTSMIDRLEETTGAAQAGASKTGGTAASGGPAAPEATPFSRPLTGKPLEAAPALQTEQEEKDYKGEFYPVARPHTKKE
jgi:hypothetical protein